MSGARSSRSRSGNKGERSSRRRQERGFRGGGGGAGGGGAREALLGVMDGIVMTVLWRAGSRQDPDTDTSVVNPTRRPRPTNLLNLEGRRRYKIL